MGLVARIAGILLATAVAVVIVVVVWLQDANNLKPELERLIAENSDYTAHFNGALSWSLFPPLQLQVQDLELNGEGEQISITALDLKMDLSAMWEDINQWRVRELRLIDTTRRKDAATTFISSLKVKDFRPGQPSAFSASASHAGTAESEPLQFDLSGQLTWHPATESQTQRITLTDTQVVTDPARGVCQADLTEGSNVPAVLPTPAADDLLPIAVLRSYDFSADCELSDLTLGSETFHQSTVQLTNVAGHTNVLLNIQDFLDGTFLADIDIDTTRTPVQWTIAPEIQNVDSQRLLTWADQRLQWVAAVAFSSSITMYGNTERELLASVHAASEFDGGHGQLNIATIKEQLMRIALLIHQSEEIAAWPDVWNYEEFTGRWNVNGPVHDLKFAIDNMSVDANGEYDYFEDTMDFLLNVTVHPAPEGSPFTVNPMLEGTPIPVRCTGSSAEPECRLDEDAVKQLVARALRQGDETGLRHKLEKKIEEDVPEEYQEAAKGILDLLGRALDQN